MFPITRSTSNVRFSGSDLQSLSHDLFEMQSSHSTANSCRTTCHYKKMATFNWRSRQLPPAVRDAPSLLSFRSRLKTWLFELTLVWHWLHSPAALHFVCDFSNSVKCPCNVTHDSVTLIFTFLIIIIIRSNLWRPENTVRCWHMVRDFSL